MVFVSPHAYLLELRGHFLIGLLHQLDQFRRLGGVLRREERVRSALNHTEALAGAQRLGRYLSVNASGASNTVHVVLGVILKAWSE